MGIYWISDIALSVASTAIACAVFAFYLAQLLKNRSKFVYGLAFLSGALFAESLLASFMYFKFSTEYGAELAIPLMGMTSLTLIALASFAYVVRQRVDAGLRDKSPFLSRKNVQLKFVPLVSFHE